MRDTLPPTRGRRQRDDRNSSARSRRAANEIDLSAEAAVGPGAQRIGAYLTGQIDLQRRVDRHHPVVLRHHERIVDVRDRPEFKAGILVDVVEELLRAEHERRDRLCRDAATCGDR